MSTTTFVDCAPINPVAWARAIDVASEGGATEVYRPPPLKPPPSGPTTAGEGVSSIDAIAILLEKASTPQEQLELSNGLPLVFNATTQRYSLAPTAEAVLRFTLENANKPPPKINLHASTLFKMRTTATLEARQ
jgi:hypothetical protein